MPPEQNIPQVQPTGAPVVQDQTATVQQPTIPVTQDYSLAVSPFGLLAKSVFANNISNPTVQLILFASGTVAVYKSSGELLDSFPVTQLQVTDAKRKWYSSNSVPIVIKGESKYFIPDMGANGSGPGSANAQSFFDAIKQYQTNPQAVGAEFAQAAQQQGYALSGQPGVAPVQSSPQSIQNYGSVVGSQSKTNATGMKIGGVIIIVVSVGIVVLGVIHGGISLFGILGVVLGVGMIFRATKL